MLFFTIYMHALLMYLKPLNLSIHRLKRVKTVAVSDWFVTRMVDFSE
jgi:hypothetical protein